MSEEFIEDIISQDISATGPSLEELAEQEKSASTDATETQPQNDVLVEEDKSQNLNETDVKQSDNAIVGDTSETSVEELATQLGWNKNYNADDKVDASTYILRSRDIQKNMSQHNKDLKNQLTTLNSSVEALKVHNEKVYQADVKKLQGEVAGLKKERRDAIELADVEKVELLDGQIAEKQKDIDTPQPTEETQAPVNPAFDDWIKDNKWYNDDTEMAQYADTVAQQYQGAPLERIYSLVRQKVQEVFPDKFDSVKAEETVKTEVKPVENPVGPASPVEGASNKGSEAIFSKADLTSDQLQIMQQFVKGGIMTEDQYINDIAKLQE